MKRSLAVGLLAGALAIACGAGGSASAGNRGVGGDGAVTVPVADGPVAVSDIVDSYGQAIDAGDEFSLGTIRLFIERGQKEATVDRVRLVGVGGPLELLGIRTRSLPQPK